MALIKNAQPKETSGAYHRLFGNSQLGRLISRVQSAVISSGTELERMIKERVRLIDDLDAFLKTQTMPDGVWVATKNGVKKCVALNYDGSEPDFFIFKRREGIQYCHIVELKDGHIFDTKKAAAEREAAHGFVKQNARHLQYRMSCHFCAFNLDDRDAIWKGFKKRIRLDEIMTGREFCDLLEIDYEEIVESRKAHGPVNMDYFISELVRIPEVKSKINRLLRQ